MRGVQAREGTELTGTRTGIRKVRELEGKTPLEVFLQTSDLRRDGASGTMWMLSQTRHLTLAGVKKQPQETELSTANMTWE